MTADAVVARDDGRTRRRRRNVDAVVEAVIALADGGNADPTSEEIAAIAGISHRSIYRYFDTRADLLDAAVVHAFDAAMADTGDDELLGQSFAARVERIVSVRLEIARRVRAIVRIAHAHHASEAVERARSTLRMQLADAFAGELAQFDPVERRNALALVDVAFQIDALDYLGTSVGLDDRELRESLARHVSRHLSVN